MGLQSWKQAVTGSMLRAIQFVGLGLFLQKNYWADVLGAGDLFAALRANLPLSVDCRDRTFL